MNSPRSDKNQVDLSQVEPDKFSSLSNTNGPKPSNSGFLERPGSIGHKIYFEEYGDASDPPVLFIHGTAIPFNDNQLRFIDDLNIRAVVFHQRGVGNSEPAGEIIENNLEATLTDIEALRLHLSIDNWHILGWSLGSTFSLSYAESHPDVCKSLTLAGVFLASNEEYEGVLADDFKKNPDKFNLMASYLDIDIKTVGLAKVIEETAKLFHSGDPKTVKEAVSMWETGKPDSEIDIDKQNYLIVNFHYKVNNYFVKSKEILGNLDRVNHCPLRILVGNNDYVVRPESSLKLAAAHSNSKIITTDSDHFFQSPEAQGVLAEQIGEMVGLEL